jgi:hypothetical protein
VILAYMKDRLIGGHEDEGRYGTYRHGTHFMFMVTLNTP